MSAELRAGERLALDGTLEVTLSGVGPGDAVTLGATMDAPDGVRWTSAAEFAADATGTVRVGDAEALRGSYEGRDPNGLLWSLVPDDRDVAETSTFFGELDPLEVELAASVDGGEVGRTTVVIERRAPGVRHEPVRTTGLYGELFVPEGGGPFRPVLVLGGSDGGLKPGTACFLAGHGYLALSLAYFAAPGLPEDLVDIDLEYFGRALALLRARPEADGPPAVLGRSRGGELSLLLGLHLGVDTVIAWVPSPIVHAGITKGEDGWLSDVPSWRVDGRPVPYLAHDDGQLHWRDGAVVCSPTYLLALENWDRVEAAMLPLEEMASKVLLLSGALDAMWPSALYSELAMTRLRLRTGGRQRHVMAPGAGHIFGHPVLPATLTVSRHPQGGERVDCGGSPRANAAAGRRAYAEVLRALAGDIAAEEWT